MTHVELITPSPLNWKVLGSQIYEVERSVFGEKSLSKKMMESDINDPKTKLVLLKDKNLIVGFTYALPESEGVARIVDTVIAKKYQNKGFISELMSCIEKELRNDGYRYITMDAMIENGYANKVFKNYNSRIIETREIVSEWGKQQYFKIQL